jgi:hypothetical protein
MELASVDQRLVHVAPHPVLARFGRPDDRVPGRPEMLARVLVLGGIAAADVAAAQAQAKMDPRVSGGEAFLATVGLRVDVANLTDV